MNINLSSQVRRVYYRTSSGVVFDITTNGGGRDDCGEIKTISWEKLKGDKPADNKIPKITVTFKDSERPTETYFLDSLIPVGDKVTESSMTPACGGSTLFEKYKNLVESKIAEYVQSGYSATFIKNALPYFVFKNDKIEKVEGFTQYDDSKIDGLIANSIQQNVKTIADAEMSRLCDKYGFETLGSITVGKPS